MSKENTLLRFEEIQADTYPSALAEIRVGKKSGHWMWFIFPQIKGLGTSEMTRHYAIRNKAEAAEYLRHPVLGKRLIEISSALLTLNTNNAEDIFGHIDSLKLRSCMTLFSSLTNSDPVFKHVIEKFFGGQPDEKTLAILNN